MRPRTTPALPIASAALATLLLAGTASAQSEPAAPAASAPAAPAPAASAPAPAAADPATPPPKRDKVRLRSGFSAYGGGLIWPDVFTLGIAGLAGETGVQINNLIGVYAVPNFEFAFGDYYGIKVGGAVLADFTFFDHLTVGAGPDVAAFVAFGYKELGAVSSALYGGRIRLAAHPGVGHGDDGIRRKAFTIGVDARFYSGTAAFAGVGGAGAAINQFVFVPTAYLGYTGF
jgi:hypothetical protein